jgi:hypothetical protein
MFPGRPGFARMAAVAAASASCLAATACGGVTASSNAAPRASSTQDPLASLTATKVAAEALANLKAASSWKLVGTGTDSGAKVTLDLSLKPGYGCEGTVEEGSEGTIKLIVIGKTVYFNPSTQFWKSQAGSHASAVIALVNGRYIKTSTSAPGMSSMTSLCDISKEIGSQKITGSLTKGKPTVLGGVRVLPIVNDKGSVLYVTDTSKPEIAEVVDSKADGGPDKFTVSAGVPVTLTAPPASQVIDGSAIGM